MIFSCGNEDGEEKVIFEKEREKFKINLTKVLN